MNGHKYYGQQYIEQIDGLIEIGRGLDFDQYVSQKEKGAHALGYNSESIGVCCIGQNKPTPNQFITLELFCKLWKKIVPEIEIIGHNDVNNTQCPGFNVPKWATERNIC